MQKLGFYTVLLDYTVGAFTSPDVIFTFKITHGHTPDVMCMSYVNLLILQTRYSSSFWLCFLTFNSMCSQGVFVVSSPVLPKTVSQSETRRSSV